MALIKCTECGHEISDKATLCVHCGCPLSETNKKQAKTNLNSTESKIYVDKENSLIPKKLLPKQKRKSIGFISIFAIIFVLILVICALFFNKEPQNDLALKSTIDSDIKMVVEILYSEKESILSNFSGATEEGGTILIPGSFAELKGTYKVFTDDNIVSRVIFVKDEEIKNVSRIVNGISSCLGNYDTYDKEWNKYDWKTDELELMLYIDERIYFDPYEYDDEINLDKNETSNTEERAEARNYDEFKYAVEECIQLVPNCNLDLDYTDNNNSYSININDKIIGIFGTEIDTWDAVALTDPDKDDATLHHEQISIALIMACDSDVTYEDAKKIFDEADEEGSAMISSGIYFFEGVSDGMYAGGVDITWLGSSF